MIALSAALEYRHGDMRAMWGDRQGTAGYVVGGVSGSSGRTWSGYVAGVRRGTGGWRKGVSLCRVHLP